MKTARCPVCDAKVVADDYDSLLKVKYMHTQVCPGLSEDAREAMRLIMQELVLLWFRDLIKDQRHH